MSPTLIVASTGDVGDRRDVDSRRGPDGSTRRDRRRVEEAGRASHAREPGFNELVSDAVCDVVLARIPSSRQFLQTCCVLIPIGGRADAIVETGDDPGTEIVRRAEDVDLVILGLQLTHDRRRAIGDFTLRIARDTRCALMVLGQKRPRLP